MKNILLVKDAGVQRDVLKTSLEKNQYHVDDALEQITASKLMDWKLRDKELYDLLIIDLPDEDWIYVAEEFRNKFPNGKIISAYAPKDRYSWEIKCDYSVWKIYPAQEILNIISEQINHGL
jgi:DNA-binding response OmpR family regulator